MRHRKHVIIALAVTLVVLIGTLVGSLAFIATRQASTPVVTPRSSEQNAYYFTPDNNPSTWTISATLNIPTEMGCPDGPKGYQHYTWAFYLALDSGILKRPYQLIVSRTDCDPRYDIIYQAFPNLPVTLSTVPIAPGNAVRIALQYRNNAYSGTVIVPKSNPINAPPVTGMPAPMHGVASLENPHYTWHGTGLFTKFDDIEVTGLQLNGFSLDQLQWQTPALSTLMTSTLNFDTDTIYWVWDTFKDQTPVSSRKAGAAITAAPPNHN